MDFNKVFTEIVRFYHTTLVCNFSKNIQFFILAPNWKAIYDVTMSFATVKQKPLSRSALDSTHQNHIDREWLRLNFE